MKLRLFVMTVTADRWMAVSQQLQIVLTEFVFSVMFADLLLIKDTVISARAAAVCSCSTHTCTCSYSLYCGLLSDTGPFLPEECIYIIIIVINIPIDLLNFEFII